MILYVQLPNFPEWAIPFTKVVPMASTDDAYDLSKVTFNVYCYHLWHITDNPENPSIGSSVELRIDVSATATMPDPTNKNNTPIQVPVYLDIDLVFFNERVAIQNNNNKV
jgi:hypothetical protein